MRYTINMAKSDTKKVSKKTKKETEVESDHVEENQEATNWRDEVPDEEELVAETGEQEEVDQSLHPEYPTESIANFDRSEVLPYEDMTMKDLSAVKALKVLVRRGEDTENPNPALAGGCLKLLRMLNREKLHTEKKREDRSERRSNNFRSRRDNRDNREQKPNKSRFTKREDKPREQRWTKKQTNNTTA